MKQTIHLIIASALVIAGCCGKTTYSITGTWTGGDGEKIYVLDGPDAKDPLIDSIVVADGKFTVASLELGKIVTLYAGSEGLKKALIFTQEPATVNIKAKENGKLEVEVLEPSVEQKMLETAISRKMMSGLMSLGRMMALAQVKDDPAKLDSTYKQFVAMEEGLNSALNEHLDSTLNFMATAYAIEILILPDRPIAEGSALYEKLTPEVKKSYTGRRLKEKINNLLDVNMGGLAPDIDLPAPNGAHVKLSSLRGKYVLLDFWASWCGPCLREVPNVKAIYDDYKDKGFEIYGVSLDDEHQRDAWLAAMEAHNMNWVHVSALKGWNCPAAHRYAVTGIPKMYLLDKEGRIIGMDLRGEALREKVASLFE